MRLPSSIGTGPRLSSVSPVAELLPRTAVARIATILAVAILAGVGIQGCGGDRRSDQLGDQPSQPRGTAGSGRVDPGLEGGKRPNFVVVVTDDQTLDQFSAESMPNVWEFFSERGTRFENAIVTSPLCCPARSSMLTGQYAHNHGVMSNSYAQLRQPNNIMPLWLQRAGYKTAHVGKYLNNFDAASPRPERAFKGWDEWHTLFEPQRYLDYQLGENGKVVDYGVGKGSYLTRVLNARARRIVRDFSERPAPFYLQIDHYAPHTSGGRYSERCRHSAVPAERDEAAVAPDPVPAEAGPERSRSFNEQNISDKPDFIRSLAPLTRPERTRARLRYSCALAALKSVDRGFAGLIESLESSGELDDTVVLFTSDNGYYFGEHRIPGEKHFPYDEGLRVPLAIAMPSRLVPPAFRPESASAAVANIDIAPTFLPLAGAVPCAFEGQCRRMDGRSLLPLLAPSAGLPGAQRFRNRALGGELGLRGNRESYARVCRYSAARTTRRVVIEHFSAAPPRGDCRPSDEIEHYNLIEDAAQLHNLASSGPPRAGVPASERAAGARLLRRMRTIRRCSGVQGRDRPLPRRPFCE